MPAGIAMQSKSHVEAPLCALGSADKARPLGRGRRIG